MGEIFDSQKYNFSIAKDFVKVNVINIHWFSTSYVIHIHSEPVYFFIQNGPIIIQLCQFKDVC